MRHAAAHLTLAAALFAAGCKAADAPKDPFNAPAVPAAAPEPVPSVVLPDLSGAAPSIRTQIQSRYDALMADARTNHDTAAMANEYGEFGQLLTAAHLYDAALPAFLNARAQAPSEAKWHYYLGTLYRKQGAMDKAETEYRRTLDLDSSNVAAAAWLGRIYLDAGRPDDAKKAYARSISIEPSYSAEFGLGRVALDQKDYSTAIQHLERALQLQPDASIVHYSLSLAYRGAGQPQKADEELKLRGTVDYDPPDPLSNVLPSLLNDAVGYYQRGMMAFNQGAFGEAIDDFKAGLALNPPDWRLRESTRYTLGTAYLRTNNIKAAAEQYEAGIRAVPDRPEHYYGLGLVLMAEGRPREAADRFAAAVKRDPKYTQAAAALADAQRQLQTR